MDDDGFFEGGFGHKWYYGTPVRVPNDRNNATLICLHCGKQVYHWFVRINGYCPSCSKPISPQEADNAIRQDL